MARNPIEGIEGHSEIYEMFLLDLLQCKIINFDYIVNCYTIHFVPAETTLSNIIDLTNILNEYGWLLTAGFWE